MYLKQIITKVNSWSELKNVLETKTKLEKGKAFEELTKYYLQYNPIYKSKLKNVWLQREVSPSLLKKLALPNNDQGIDLIAETFDGSYWAIQCKYLQDEDKRLSHRAISTFVSLSTGIAKNISYCLVCTTLDDYAKIYHGNENIGFCTSDEWRKLDKTFFDWLRNTLAGKVKKSIAYKPKPHQAKALKEAKDYFVKENNKRGKLVFPCGAGKSLTGYWITRELNAQRIIVAVPSLSLVKQTLEVYLRETLANNDTVAWLCVCSDEGIGKNDDITIHTNEIGVPCVTDKNIIADWLKKNKNNKTIIFSTYQSGKTIAEACKIAKHSFDLGIMDEAHKTVGDKDKLFSHLLFDNNLQIEKRIFMTATERRYAGASDTVLSMDDVAVYGDTFTQLSFKEAIEIGILADYKIITLFISNEEVKKLISENAFVKPTGKDWDNETEARTLAALIALRKAMIEYPIHHAVTFHSSIKKAEAFEQSQALFSKAYPKFGKVDSYHVSGAMPTSVRGKVVDEFAASEKAIITNAKCLTEGVDVPNIDCVLFADPRKSTVDIVQAVGRALRKKEGKDYGYVILPVFTNSNTTEEIIESDEFKEILSTIRALAANDERIIEYFRDINRGKKINKKDYPIQFNIDINISKYINENDLINKLELTTWNKLAKLSWMPFEEARTFIRSLGFNSLVGWNEYIKSKKMPADIPNAPQSTYRNFGWKGFGDWLGTGTIATFQREYKPFEDARTFVQSLKLKNNKEWESYRKSSKMPNDIPSNPNETYKDKGWISLGDWLGNGKIATHLIKYREFNEARAFVHGLNLKNEFQWMEYCKSEKKPLDIPNSARTVYKDKGYLNLGDWLGTGTVAPFLKEYRDFNAARNYVRSLGIKSTTEWFKYCKSDEKPIDIPADPRSVYKNMGFVNIGDWLGTGTIAAHLKQYRDFNLARNYVNSLGIKSTSEWFKYCKSDKKPEDIPANPSGVYKNKGFLNMADWLGVKLISFKDAKKHIIEQNIKSKREFKQYARSSKNTNNIPICPDAVFKSEWKGWADFLGKE